MSLYMMSKNQSVVRLIVKGDREMSLSETIENKCKSIIHGHAAAAAAGNMIPVPGTGFAADIITMTTMTMALSAVFGGQISENVAKNLTIAAIKRTILSEPIEILSREVAKFIPFLGQAVSASISVAILESAGWALANELSKRAKLE